MKPSRLLCILLIAVVASLHSVRAQRPGEARVQVAAQPTPAMRNISKTLAVPPEALTKPNLKVIVGGQAVEPGEVSATAPVKLSILAERTGASARALSSNEVLAANLGDKPVAAYALPIKFRALARAPGATVSRPVQYGATVVVLKVLQYSESARRFEADLEVVLHNSADPTDRSTLDEAMKVLVSSNAGEATPSEFMVARFGDSRGVKVSAIMPVAPFKVTARTLLDGGDPIEVPVVRPTIAVEASGGSINGWGLEKTDIAIRAAGLETMEGRLVTVKASRGEVKPREVKLSKDGYASVSLRSVGTGVAQITVSGEPFQSGEAQIPFVQPWGYLVATLLGAVIGWLAKTKVKNLTVRNFVYALVSALFVAIAWSVGMKLFNFAPEATAGEALVVFWAAVGAYFGAKKALDSLGKAKAA